MAAAAARGAKRRRQASPTRASKEAAPGSQLLVEQRNVNGLPKPPVPKLLRHLPALNKSLMYQPTSRLEVRSRPALVSEVALAACTDLLNADVYGELPSTGSMRPPLPPQDAALLRDDDLSQEEREAEVKRRRLSERTEAFHREAFGLQLPQLITNDVFTERQRYTTGMEATEKKLFREAPGYASAEDLADRIEATFEAAQQAPSHPSEPSKKVKRVMQVVPDAVLWTNKYRQVICDEYAEEPRTDDILLKTVPNPRATCFSYFSPSADGSGDFSLSQDYIWDNRGAFTKMMSCTEGETVLLSFPSEEEENAEVRFVVAPTTMRLKKQKAARLDITLEAKSLSVGYREPNADEQQDERVRMSAVLSEDPEDIDQHTELSTEGSSKAKR
eukprot:TRINITY_DN7222_c0_g2_i1.p2 TRINITY_DN7222_c0_g2~~TRINITY_DN7222_c0_g2_i1.p2  ORF type:complete len:388 (-),score=121.86 TRINITY_DN7222_c0_g2_i1:125-1288(-)